MNKVVLGTFQNMIKAFRILIERDYTYSKALLRNQIKKD